MSSFTFVVVVVFVVVFTVAVVVVFAVVVAVIIIVKITPLPARNASDHRLVVVSKN